MIILCFSLGDKSFSNFYHEMLFVNNLYTKISFCSDHEVVPKVIIRVMQSQMVGRYIFQKDKTVTLYKFIYRYI